MGEVYGSSVLQNSKIGIRWAIPFMAGLESGVPRGLRLGEAHGSSVLLNSKRGIKWAIPFMAGLASGVPRGLRLAPDRSLYRGAALEERSIHVPPFG